MQCLWCSFVWLGSGGFPLILPCHCDPHPAIRTPPQLYSCSGDAPALTIWHLTAVSALCKVPCEKVKYSPGARETWLCFCTSQEGESTAGGNEVFWNSKMGI